VSNSARHLAFSALAGAPFRLRRVAGDGRSALLDLRERIAGLALRRRLPTFSSIPEFTDAGVLVGYGPARRDSYRRAATYVKKVLEGAKPANIPVEQPTLIELSINMRTAKALGIVIPDALLARAERVID
jgi:putative ABC transport system substrate-binding protein